MATSPLTYTTSSNASAIKPDQPECFRHEAHYEKTLKRLHDRQDLCDLVLIVGDSGKRIFAHRLLLIAASDYFSALLSGSMSESQKREITLNEVDGGALEELVNFCYTGSVEFRVDTIGALLGAANYLQFNEVFEPGCEFLVRHLHRSNCLDVAIFAQQLNLAALLHEAGKIISEYFEDLANDPKILLLNAESLIQIIASDSLDVPSEEFVFRFVMKWIEYEPEDRRPHFTDLLAQVRLALLPSSFLSEMIEPHCNTAESQNFVLESLKSHPLLTNNSPQTSQTSGNQSVAKHLLGIHNRSFQDSWNISIGDYNLQTQVWRIWRTPIEIRTDPAFALIDDSLIVVGGFHRKGSCRDVTSVNLHTLAATAVLPMRTGRTQHSVGVLNGSVYAIGGCLDHSFQPLNSVERWSPMNRTWRYVAPMANVRWRAGVAALNNLLYVSGGLGVARGHSDGYTSMECYDPVENIWKFVAPMKEGRSSHGLVAHNGYLFAIGGSANDFIEIPVERYDPRTDTWTTISCSPGITEYCSCTSFGPDIFINHFGTFYVARSEGSCDHLEPQLIPNPTSTKFICNAFFPISYEFKPPEKLQMKKQKEKKLKKSRR